jgi:hypothetical protein
MVLNFTVRLRVVMNYGIIQKPKDLLLYQTIREHSLNKNITGKTNERQKVTLLF